mmetsp:Transcript_1685/g.4784  ORF Transcript_1685/g.4784 Transcript_1685/m.4784 type:complete len:210 (-) Transcript_1685:303-932(-)
MRVKSGDRVISVHQRRLGRREAGLHLYFWAADRGGHRRPRLQADDAGRRGGGVGPVRSNSVAGHVRDLHGRGRGHLLRLLGLRVHVAGHPYLAPCRGLRLRGDDLRRRPGVGRVLQPRRGAGRGLSELRHGPGADLQALDAAIVHRGASRGRPGRGRHGRRNTRRRPQGRSSLGRQRQRHGLRVPRRDGRDVPGRARCFGHGDRGKYKG